MTTHTFLLDFFGTLVWARHWGPDYESILVAHGAPAPTVERHLWSSDAYDGQDLSEHAASRDVYVAWERMRLEHLAIACGVPPPRATAAACDLWAAAKQYELVVYDDTVDVLRALRRQGRRLVICSNWDWDLPDLLGDLGLADLVDGVVTSARAGSRKPHPRIYAAALEIAEASVTEAVFVGDSWGPDVEGPLALGMRAVHVARPDHHDPDGLPPIDQLPPEVVRVADLRPLVEIR
jgi:putative hydrolase of the HAD superfamily